MSHSHWAYQQAEAIARRTGSRMATFETGYGPSGLPHMGTVGEVLRTAMVARAYREVTSGAPMRLLAVTDDMDGLRKAPGNVPRREMLEGHLGAPLCAVPDPFGTHESFASHNAALLRGHLRHFGLRPVEPHEAMPRLLAGEATEPDEVLCLFASDLYRGGVYDPMLRRVAEHAEEIAGIILPTLGDERRRTWCPFVPLHDGRMVTDTRDWRIRDLEVLEWSDAEGTRHETSLYGGMAKLQWKVDWAMRWVALGVDFEMHGKDLADSVTLGRRIAALLGGRGPVTFQYELFLDEEGRKISKSVGNGVEIEDWERHAPPAAFWSFLSRDPRRARRVGRDTLPSVVDEWLRDLRDSPAADEAMRLLHPEGAPAVRFGLSFSTVLGVAVLADAEEPGVLWSLLSGYDPAGVVRDDPLLGALIDGAIARHLAVGRPSRVYRVPDEAGRAALGDLVGTLRAIPSAADAEAIQCEVYEAGKRHGGREGLRDFFRLVYGVLLGEESGPRLGTLASAVGTGYLADRLEAVLTSSSP